MVKRPAKGSFAGAHVFPGGVVDTADTDAAIYALADGLDDAQASKRLRLDADGLAYYVAAIRETFEESGYLLARQRNGRFVDGRLLHECAAGWRTRLASGQATLLELCRELDVRLAVDALAYVSFWLTPRSEKRRFATRFFVAEVPPDQAGEHDGAELVDSFWITPASALAPAQGLNLTPPTRAQLLAMQQYHHAPEAVAATRQRAPHAIPCVFGQVSIDSEGKRHFSHREFPRAPEAVSLAGTAC